MTPRKRTQSVFFLVLAGVACFAVALGYFLYVSRTASSSFEQPSIVRLPVPASKEAFIYEFYDDASPNQIGIQKEMDNLAKSYRSYDHRVKVSNADPEFSALKSEFGISRLPAVALTNRNRDYKLVFSGPEIYTQLKESLQSFGYKKAAASGFG